MAIKIGGDEVITNAKNLELIANCDVTTSDAINQAIVRQINVLRIYNSVGTEVRTLYCADGS